MTEPSSAGGLDARLRLVLGSLDLAVDLTLQPGAVAAVLGPNGAGKTTVLRCLAGLQAVDDGAVRLDGRVLDEPATRTWVPPERRDVGYVHQDLLLFPHQSALDNVAFGLRARGATRAAARTAAAGWLDRVGLADRAAARPAALSGGQAQRVALARALAVEPDLLLLDEPLAALDAATRTATRRDLRRHLDGFAGVAVVVTHDPLDALLLADEVVVLEGGRVTQAGPVGDVAARPGTRYVADLLSTNLFRGVGRGTSVELDGTGGELHLADPVAGDTLVALAPQAVVVSRARPEGSARNVWPARVAAIDLLGDRVRLDLRLAGDRPLVAEITAAALVALALQVGDDLWASAKATELRAYPA